MRREPLPVLPPLAPRAAADTPVCVWPLQPNQRHPMIRIPLDYFGHGEGLIVQAMEGYVYLDVEAEACENADPARSVALTAEEARTLAAALRHFATELAR